MLRNIAVVPHPAITAANIQTDTMRHMLSADATFEALQEAINELARLAPEDHDVLIQAFDIAVSKVVLMEPHTLLFRGFDECGDDAFVVAHFSQVVAKVIYRPKQKETPRVITGFSVFEDQSDEEDE